MADKRKISLVLADVDGTLVNEQKVLTKRAQAAVQHLREAGIRFAITSGRPPRGMAMLLDDLKLPLCHAAARDHRAEDAARRYRRPGNRTDPGLRPRCLGLPRQ
jgi:HAD superfamily hydrolase (TIGR01484 family)